MENDKINQANNENSDTAENNNRKSQTSDIVRFAFAIANMVFIVPLAALLGFLGEIGKVNAITIIAIIYILLSVVAFFQALINVIRSGKNNK